MWRHDNPAVAATEYECTACQAAEKDKGRICFKYQEDVIEDGIDVKWPTWNDDTGELLFPGEWETAHIDNTYDVLGLLMAMEEFDKISPAWELLMNKCVRVVQQGKAVNMEVCPIAFLDEYSGLLIATESLCRTYSMAPQYPPVLEAQDPIVMSAFMTIASTKNQYELLRLERKKKT